MFTATLTRQVRSVVPVGLRITSARSQHFLANVPLKRRGVDKVSIEELKGKVSQLGARVEVFLKLFLSFMIHV